MRLGGSLANENNASRWVNFVRKSTEMKKLAYLILAATFASINGCTGEITGDFKDVEKTEIHQCTDNISDYPYHSRIRSELKNDMGFDNPLGIISASTFGLIPTYWYQPLNMVVSINKDNKKIAEYHYKGGIHKKYGILWFIPRWFSSTEYQPGKNEIVANEGEGLPVKDIIEARAARKASADFVREFGVKNSDLCFSFKNSWDQ
jgi:hypothetical protein